MTYAETLSALLGLIGRDLTIHIRVPGNPNVPGLATLSGTLARGDDYAKFSRALKADVNPTGAVRFTLAVEGLEMQAFLLDPPRWVSTRWDEQEPVPTLRIMFVNDVEMVITDEHARPSSGPLVEG